MDKDTIKIQALNFSKSRSNLLLVIALTIANILFIATDASFTMLFSASLPEIIMIFFGGDTTAIIFSSGIIGVYILFWALSKTYRGAIIGALVFYGIDILIFSWLLLSFIDNWNFGYIVEILFRLWVLYYLVIGTIAWKKLRTLTPHDFKSALTAEFSEKKEKEALWALQQLSEDKDKDKDENTDEDEKSE